MYHSYQRGPNRRCEVCNKGALSVWHFARFENPRLNTGKWQWERTNEITVTRRATT